VRVVWRVRFFGTGLGPCTPLNRSDVRAPLHHECIIGKFKNSCALAPPSCVSTWRAVQWRQFFYRLSLNYVRIYVRNVCYHYGFAQVAFFISSAADNECKSEELHLNARAERAYSCKFIACDSYAVTLGTIYYYV